MDKYVHRKNLRQTSIITQPPVRIKKETIDEENGTDDMMEEEEEVDDVFVCEFCDDKRSEGFPFRESLISHCLKSHPTACLGCFEMFGSSSDLLEHLEAFPHEPPVCRDCCRSFGSIEAKVKHECVTGSSCKKRNDISIKDPDFIKTETLDSEYENESNIEDRYVPEESSGEDDSFDDDDDYDYEYEASSYKTDSNIISVYTDSLVNCINCSFVARGNERKLSVDIIRNHTVSAHPTACCICFEIFENKEALNLHEESLKHKTWRCDHCVFVTVKRPVYISHQKRNHPDQCQFQCPKCPARYFVRKQLRNHISRKHSHGDGRSTVNSVDHGSILPVNICTICDYSTQTTFAIMMHMFEKHPEPNQLPTFKCDECQLGYSRPNHFGRHIMEKHRQDSEFQKVYQQLLNDYSISFDCESCKKEFRCRKEFSKHLSAIHPLSIPHHCSICNSGYLDPFDMQVHECRDHKNTSPYACDKCNNSFKNLSRLVNHFVRVHKMTTMPYIYCYIHNVGFCSNDNTGHHFENFHKVKVKPPPEAFQCKICGRCMSTKYALQTHEAGHGSERPFKCSVCGKAFAALGLLKNHEVMHSSKNQCDICGKTFHSQLFLKRHAVVHTGEKPFECSICGLRVSQNSALKRHMEKVHPGGIMGKPRSTKPRKCRVLSKTLEKQKEIASDKREDAKMEEAAPSPRRPQNYCSKAKPSLEQKNVPVVQLDTWLLKADLRTKPQPILPAGRKGRKRQRKAMSSEESSSEDEDGISSSVGPSEPAQRNTETEEESPKAKKRKRKTKPWSRAALSSTDDDKSSESDDGSDTPYLPNVNENRNRATRRSSRLNQ